MVTIKSYTNTTREEAVTGTLESVTSVWTEGTALELDEMVTGDTIDEYIHYDEAVPHGNNINDDHTIHLNHLNIHSMAFRSMANNMARDVDRAMIDRMTGEQKPADNKKCEHCKGRITDRNPTGFCDHLHYPEYCRVCKRMRREKESDKT